MRRLTRLARPTASVCLKITNGKDIKTKRKNNLKNEMFRQGFYRKQKNAEEPKLAWMFPRAWDSGVLFSTRGQRSRSQNVNIYPPHIWPFWRTCLPMAGREREMRHFREVSYLASGDLDDLWPFELKIGTPATPIIGNVHTALVLFMHLSCFHVTTPDKTREFSQFLLITPEKRKHEYI